MTFAGSDSMAPIVVDRKSRATRQTAPRVCPTSLANEYAAYLQSSTWRRRRDRALRDAGYRCEDCDARKGLQVHHLSYAVLGGLEPKRALRVVCRECHEGAHVEQDKREHAGVYVALVSDVLKRERFTCWADLLDATKDACRRVGLRWRMDHVYMAARELDAKRKGIFDAPTKPVVHVTPVTDDRPIGRADAERIIRALNIKIGFRDIPSIAYAPHGASDDFRRACGLWDRPDLDAKQGAHHA